MPYEVVLEGDTDSIVTKMLTEDVTGLPQPEPLCRLIQVKKGKTQGNYLLVRTRIVVNIGERDFSVTLQPRRECCATEYHSHNRPIGTAVAGKAQWRETPPNRG